MRRPQCPRHASSVVWLDGTYGRAGRRRQRFKCVPKNGEKRHVFTEALPRQLTSSGHCDECERPWGPNEGAPSARQHSFTASEIAWALTRVGEGWTYRATTQRVRERAGRLKGRLTTGLAYATRDSSTVEDWVEAYAPVIVQPRLADEYPEVLVIDDLPFTAKTPLFGGPFGVVFRVYGALAYSSGKSKLLRLEAFPDGKPANWVSFFKQLEGMPQVIVCDAHSGMLKAIEQVWGRRPYHSPVVWLCHWHLEHAFRKLVRSGGLRHSLLDVALTHAFRDERRWRRFLRYVDQMGTQPMEDWLTQPDRTWWAGHGTRSDRILWQLRNRGLGIPETIQTLETQLDWVRQKIQRRKFSFRNRARTNLLLSLLMLHRNGQDDERAYAREIRLHLEQRAGIARPRHLITDPVGVPSLWGH